VAGNVLILGAGPAGLLAAYAVEQMGGEPSIVSRPSRESPGQPGKSVFQGAQYLHESIPGLTNEPDGVIRTIKTGTKEGYAKKVYGDPAAPVSWDDQPPERAAWDLRAVYDRLWDRYQSRIAVAEVTWDDLDAASKRPEWELIISTLPAIHMCHQKRERCGDHEFKWESMYTLDFAPDDLEDNTVLYSGDPEQFWYRTSRVFGHVSTECTDFSQPSGGAVLYDTFGYDGDPTVRVVIPRKGIKVKGTNCDCWPKIKRVGRFGTWRKGYLSHHAYRDAMALYASA
jgi:hypothetical protein